MSKYIKHLDWDSHYFDVKAGVLILDNLILDEINVMEIKKEFLNYDFVTIRNENNSPAINSLISQLSNVQLVDINIQFEKKWKNIAKVSNMESANVLKLNTLTGIELTEVQQIVKNTFTHSRFYSDKKIDTKKADMLYSEWIANSVQEENTFFLVYEQHNSIIGFILMKEEQEKLFVQLISVHSDYRGQNIGSKLMDALFVIARKKEKNIYVGTQINNISAVNFYARHGFKYIYNQSIFHYWKG